jgi:hypothetical protein
MTRTMSLSRIYARLLRVAVACFVIVVLSQGLWGQDICPAPTPSISSPNLPTDVILTCPNGNGINDFDDFSWRSFVALIWPAVQGQRGVPDTTKTNFPVSGPLVFETYKADWESFPPPKSPNPPPAPAPWTSFAGTNNPCGSSVNVGWGDLVLASYTKFGNLGLAGFGNFFTGPLIASGFTQQGMQQYVRFQASYNETEYNQILDNRWYLQANLGNLTFCSNGATVNGQACPAENSVDLKASWIDMSTIPAAQQSRYYTTQAWVLDPATNACSQRNMGLVGLHIVSKTPTRPQWIWSTFEQIDNVPAVTGATPTKNTVFNFNDGQGAPMPAKDPYCVPGQPGCPAVPPPPAAMPFLASQGTRFNVTRVKPIGIGPATTPATNAAYQGLLAQAAPNSPWQYYELVMSQWPVPGNTPANPGGPKFSFPGKIKAGDDASSFANVTLETFDQTSIFTGCMNCHNATAHPGGAATGNDFLWSLAVNAYPPPESATKAALRMNRSGVNPTTLAAFKSLAALQKSAIEANQVRMLRSVKKRIGKPKNTPPPK